MDLEILANCFRDTRPLEEDRDFTVQYKQWSLTRNRVAMKLSSEDGQKFITLSDVVKPR